MESWKMEIADWDITYHPDIFTIHRFIQYLAKEFPELKDKVVVENGEISFNQVPRDIMFEVIDKFRDLKVKGVTLSVVNPDGTIAYKKTK
jgi:LmbE family N-acetylglucosaminyl deacetylase